LFEKFKVITSSEAASLWRLDSSTIRRAISEQRLPAQKSSGTWLVNTEEMVKLYGMPKPELYIREVAGKIIGAETIPEIELIGCVPNDRSRMVYLVNDGSIIVIGHSNSYHV